MARNTAINLDVRPLSDGFSLSGGTTPRTFQLDGANTRFIGQQAAAFTLPNVAADNLIGESFYAAKGDLLVGDGAASTAVLSAGTDGYVLYADSEAATGLAWAALPSSAAYWIQSTESGTTHALADAESVLANNAELVDFTLPASAAVGDHFRIQGAGAGGWRISQNADQVVRLGSVASTVGVSGQVNSTNQYDCIELVCVVADEEFVVTSVIGNPDLV